MESGGNKRAMTLKKPDESGKEEDVGKIAQENEQQEPRQQQQQQKPPKEAGQN